MIEIPIRNLSRNQRRRLQESKAFGQLAEELVAEEFDLSEFNNADWYDCVNKDTGTKYEVKSTAEQIGSKYPGTGRFRLWKDNHRSIAASDGQGTAWYAFVLLSESDGSIKIQRRKPSTVSEVVRDRGGWNTSGHARGQKQHKIPYPEVI